MGKNRRNTTAKEQMLKKIRQALLQKRENPFPQFEEAPLYREEESAIPLAVLFAERFAGAGGNFVYCEDNLQLAENLLALIEQENFRKIYAWERAVQDFLTHYEFPFAGTEAGFMDAEVGITTCEALIARHGSILVSNASASGRRLSIYPPVHIVLARTPQLVLDVQDGLELMQQQYAGGGGGGGGHSAGGVLPSSFTFITGPSRTADIEKTLVLGAHGPKQVFVFLIEN